jgi:hypothetical protein
MPEGTRDARDNHGGTRRIAEDQRRNMMEQRDQYSNVVRAAVFATDADDRRLPICDPPRTHPFM